jgi:hypothetical protein
MGGGIAMKDKSLIAGYRTELEVLLPNMSHVATVLICLIYARKP